MEKLQIPQFESKSELFDFLIENKSALIAQKKFSVKFADSINYIDKGETTKASNNSTSDTDTITVKSVINTTNLMDSHSDVHIKGLWNKSLKETKDLYLLQEHKMEFDKIISDDIKANVQSMTWKELGFNLKGETQALIFESIIKRDRNEFMFKQYQNGFVKNHSVGMRYVKIELAVNSDEDYYKTEKRIWDKYIGDVANEKEASEQGYFWAVTEAKVIEGSAVPMGSNKITPTLSVENKNNEPPKGTQKQEPPKGTRNKFSINNFI
jgi:hypothetical protein